MESKEDDDPKNSCQLIPGGFAGTGPNGSFFEAPKWVDKKKAPGTTSQTDAVAPPGWWIDLATGKFLFFSPNPLLYLSSLFDLFLLLDLSSLFDSVPLLFVLFLIQLH